MIPDHVERILLWVGAAHFVAALACAAALVLEAAPTMGVHPALKPMKFGVSIALFLATMAIVIPALSIDAARRRGIAWILSLTMITRPFATTHHAPRGCALSSACRTSRSFSSDHVGTCMGLPRRYERRSPVARTIGRSFIDERQEVLGELNGVFPVKSVTRHSVRVH